MRAVGSCGAVRARRRVRGASQRTGAQHLLVHRADADALAHIARVQDRLVVHPHRRLRVEHEDIAREDPCCRGGGRGVEEHHPLPDAELADVLLGARAHDERAGLAGEQRGDGAPHVVDALDRHLVELALVVRTHEELVVDVHRAREQRAGDDEADAGDVEVLVDQELGGELVLRRPRAAARHQVEELAEQRHVRPVDGGDAEDRAERRLACRGRRGVRRGRERWAPGCKAPTCRSRWPRP